MATINFPSNTLTPGPAYDDADSGMTVGFITSAVTSGLSATGLRWYAPTTMTVTPILFDFEGTTLVDGPDVLCTPGWNFLPFNNTYPLTSGTQVMPAIFQSDTQQYTALLNAWPESSSMVTAAAGAGRFSYGPTVMLHPDMPATDTWFGLDLVVTDVVAATPPSTSAGVDQTGVAQGSTVTLTAVDTPGTNAITSSSWTWVSGGTAPTLSGSGLTRTYTAPASQVTQVFRRTVSDGTLTATDDVSITTAAAIVPPSTNAGVNQTGIKPFSTVTLTAVDTPGTNAIASSSWTWVSGGTAPTLTGSGLTRTYTAPIGLAAITQVFRRTVSDGTLVATDDISVTTSPATERVVQGGVEVPARFLIIVNSGQTVAPSTNAGANQTNVVQGSTVTLTAVDTPGTNAITSSSWAWVSGGTAPTLTGSGLTRTYTAPSSQVTQVFRRTVSDGTLTATDDVSITTAAAVVPPSTNAGTDKTNVAQGSTVTLTAVDTPGTNAITSSSWAWVSGGTAPILSGSGLSRTYTAPSSQVTQVFRRTVSDGTLTDTDDVSVTTAVAPVDPETVTFTHGSQMLAALAAGQIGLKPGVSRTSVAPFVPSAGATYQNLTINGDMDINVGSTWINCQFISNGSKPANANMWGNNTVRFEYCQFDGNNMADGGLKGQHVSVYRCEFRRCLKDAHVNDDWDFTECIGKEHWAKNAGDHRENVLRNSGTDLSSVRCYWRMEDQGNTNQYVSSAFSAYNQPESRNVTVTDNYIDGGGGGYAFYGGGSTQTSNIKVTGNIFGRALNRYSGYAGANDSTWIGTPGYEWSNNRWGPLGPDNQVGDPAEGVLVGEYGR